jgi:hypothetical protein
VKRILKGVIIKKKIKGKTKNWTVFKNGFLEFINLSFIKNKYEVSNDIYKENIFGKMSLLCKIGRV